MRIVFIVLGVAAFLLGGCASGESVATGANASVSDGRTGPTVVTTTTVLGDIVGNIVGDGATVEVLMPVGTDPHGFEASPAQAQLLRESDLVVASGLNLEESLLSVLASAEADGANVFTVSEQLDPIPFGEHAEEEHEEEDEHAEEEHEHAAGSLDPHVWQDPLRMAQGVRLIGEQIAAIDDSVDWSERAEAYAGEVEALHEEIEATIAEIPEADRLLVTNHDALGYFAERYGFEQLGVVIPGGSTLAEPSAAELHELAETIEASGVPAIFVETIQPEDLAAAVAGEVGFEVRVVRLYTDSLAEPGSDGDSYIAMMRSNATRIAEALAGE